MLKLFDVEYIKIPINENPIDIPTPFGKVHLEVFYNKIPLSQFVPNIFGEISNKSSVCIWAFNAVHIELLKTNIVPSLPLGMKVDQCIAFLWRFKSASNDLSLKLICRLAFNNKILEVVPESGGGLIAQSWTVQNTRITVGTEDEDYLLSRSEHQNGLPLRLAENQLIDSDLIEYLEEGIQITLPPFQENEEGQIQFVVAWGDKSDRDDISTWFAVDVRPQEILKSLTLGLNEK